MDWFNPKILNSIKRPGQRQGPGKVISLLNQKGGVGKTTMAFNIAHALHTCGHKVLAIDLDPQANLSLLFGHEINQPFHIFHALINSIKELKALHSPLLVEDIIHPGDIDSIPAGQELSGFELSVAGINSPRQTIFKQFIEKSAFKQKYDYIIIDGPPTLGLIVVNILCASDGVIVPFIPDKFSQKGLEHFHQVISDIEDMQIVSPPQIIGHIPNLVDKRRKQTQSDFEKIAAGLEQTQDNPKLFEGLPNIVQVVKAQGQNKSVFAYKSKEYAQLQQNFLNIAREIEKGLPIKGEN